MYLSTPHSTERVPATPASIAAIIRELPAQLEPFAILSSNDDSRFIQTRWTPRGFVLEFQEGSVARHYRCRRLDLTSDEVVGAFQQYLTWRGNWKPKWPADRVEIRARFIPGQMIAGLVRRLWRSIRAQT